MEVIEAKMAQAKANLFRFGFGGGSNAGIGVGVSPENPFSSYFLSAILERERERGMMSYLRFKRMVFGYGEFGVRKLSRLCSV